MSYVNDSKKRNNNEIPTVRAFVIRAPTLEATSHLTIDMPGAGPSAPNWLAIVTIDAMPHHRSIHPIDRMYTTVCTECNVCCACFARKMHHFRTPRNPQIVLYQRLKSMQTKRKVLKFSAPQCTKIDGQTERPLRQC